MKISNDVKDVLVKSRVEDSKLYLPDIQLDRKLYTSVNKILEDLGGKWNRKEKAHLFTNDPSDVLDEIINTGEWTDKKKEYQFFETPLALAERMVSLAEIKDGDMLLEPSAGKGNIAEHFPENSKGYLVELNPDNYNELLKKFTNFKIVMMDFLSFDGKFDKIVMNPPFSKHQDVKHILHAWSMLANGGILVSIVSESPFFREDNVSKEFRDWLDENNADVDSLESGEFKESGTMVKTRLIVVKKPQ